MAAKTKNLTTGPIGKSLLLFAAPLLVGTLIQQLYNTVDLIFVGNLNGKSASAAIGASSLLISCLIGFFNGMSVGSGVVVAQIFGAGDRARLSRAVHNAAALCIAGGLGLMALGYLLAPVYLRLIRTPAHLQPDAVAYLRIYFLSFPAVVTYNFGAGILRALGNSKSPVQAQLAGGLMNVVMDWLFIAVLQGSVRGVAWATLISQTAAAAVIVVKLIRLDPAYALRPKKTTFDREILKQVIAIGVPAGIQAMVITLSNVFVQVHINGFGEDAIAAFTAYFKVESLIYAPILAMGSAVMTFAGQNKGAGNYARVRAGTMRGLAISMALAEATALLCIPLGGVLFRFFNPEESVIALGRQIIGVTFPFYGLYSVLQILGESMRGVGKSRTPMVIILVNICLIRTVLLYIIVPVWPSVRTVAAAYPVTWALTSACMAVYYFGWHKKHKRLEVSYKEAAE